MERFFDHAEINHGRLYPNIETLVGYDLMDKSEIDGRTNAHDVTTKVDGWFETPEPATNSGSTVCWTVASRRLSPMEGRPMSDVDSPGRDATARRATTWRV